MIRIVLADDHEVVRSGFKLLLEQNKNCKVVGEAAEGSQAYAMVAREKPDVVLLDISMPPGQSGLVACEEIARDFPATKVVILTMFAEPEYLAYTLKSGASGYLVKSATAEELDCALRTVLAGKVYIHPKMAAVMEELADECNGEGGLEQLTHRELEILQLLAKGHTNKEISQQVFLSVKTIEAHRAKIYSKLGLSNRAELVEFALKHKLLNI